MEKDFKQLSGKRILINKTARQIRVACIADGKLYDLEVEHIGYEQKIDSIYNGEVVSVAPSLQAAFVNFGQQRNGFLPLKQITAEYYPDGKKTDANITEVLKEGQKVLVQVEKEESGNKGAALSACISLAGSYLVLIPNNPKASGISRRIEGQDREQLRHIRDSLHVPDSMGVIIRTAGINKSIDELQWDLDVLVQLWHSIKQASDKNKAPCLIHQESNIIMRAIRDHLRADIEEIIVDDNDEFRILKSYIEKARPNFIDRIKFYKNTTPPLFSYFNVESQIESAYKRTVKLPSGGVVVIDRTEALTAIDINSAQATRGSSIEETAFFTNLEAAREIAFQLRIRDLGGLFVIDFIDMVEQEHRRKVEECLRDAIKTDRARTQIGSISSFGLLEMSRQRLCLELSEAIQIICPRCYGQGTIRNVRSLAASIINVIEENAFKRQAQEIQVQLPVSVATFILNEKRSVIEDIQTQSKVDIVVIPNEYFETPHYEINIIKNKKGESEKNLDEKSEQYSYELVGIPPVTYKKEVVEQIKKESPLVTAVLPDKPAPKSKNTTKHSGGIIKRFFSIVCGGAEKKDEPVKKEQSVRNRVNKSTVKPYQRQSDNQPDKQNKTVVADSDKHTDGQQHHNYLRNRRNAPPTRTYKTSSKGSSGYSGGARLRTPYSKNKPQAVTTTGEEHKKAEPAGMVSNIVNKNLISNEPNFSSNVKKDSNIVQTQFVNVPEKNTQNSTYTAKDNLNKNSMQSVKAEDITVSVGLPVKNIVEKTKNKPVSYENNGLIMVETKKKD